MLIYHRVSLLGARLLGSMTLGRLQSIPKALLLRRTISWPDLPALGIYLSQWPVVLGLCDGLLQSIKLTIIQFQERGSLTQLI
jgi:hypothetical protein